MAKIVKGYNYKKVSFNSGDYNNLSDFTEIKAEAGRKGELGITETAGSYRVVLYSTILDALNDADSVKVLLSKQMLAIMAVAPGTPGAYDIRKGGIIYSSDLAHRIMEIVPDVTFKSNSTTRCGHILQVQENENGSATVILSFE